MARRSHRALLQWLKEFISLKPMYIEQRHPGSSLSPDFKTSNDNKTKGREKTAVKQYPVKSQWFIEQKGKIMHFLQQ